MSVDALDLMLVGRALSTRVRVRDLLAFGELGAGQLYCATSIDQALPQLDIQQFDGILVLMDRIGTASLNAISALNLAAPDTPILAVTGSDDLMLARLALRAGADDCLVEHELNGPVLHRAVRLGGERKQKLAKLTVQAWRDTLTGLPNRALLEDRLANMVARARRYDSLIGVLFIDLDDFKLVNDSIGHAGGDKLLRAVAERLSGAIRRGDTVARLGGDEFIVALENLQRPGDADEVAETIHGLLEKPFTVEGRPFCVSASIGVALLGPEAGDVAELLRRADCEMYRAKRGKSAPTP